MKLVVRRITQPEDHFPAGFICLEITDTLRDAALVANAAFELDKLQFHIDAYRKLHTGTADACERLLKPANDFLATLSVEAMLTVLLFYAKVAMTSSNIERDLLTLSGELDLAEKLIAFVQTRPEFNTSVAAVDHYGVSQDAYIHLVGLSIFSKVLCPLWGELIYGVDAAGVAEKERLCCHMFGLVLGQRISDNAAGWHDWYVVDTIQQVKAAWSIEPMPNRDKLHRVGVTDALIRRLVNADLYAESAADLFRGATRTTQVLKSLAAVVNFDG